MAAFQGVNFEGKSKDSRSGDSPYHIFTPDDIQLQDDSATACTFSTFHPRQVHHQEQSTNIDESFEASLPLHHTNAEESFSSSLPRYGNIGTKTSSFSSMSHRNRSIDNLTTGFVKSLPPRRKYHPSTTYTTPSVTKNLPPRRAQQAETKYNTAASVTSTFPMFGSANNTGGDISVNLHQHSERRGTNNNGYSQTEGAIDYPVSFEHFSQEYNRLQPDDRQIRSTTNIVHRNAAYASVVRRPFKERGSNSPVFDIEIEQEQNFNDDLRAWSNQPTQDSGINHFEMCSDDDSKNDSNQLEGQDEQYIIKTPISRPLSHNDYENVKEYVPCNTYGEHATMSYLKLKPRHCLKTENKDISCRSEVETPQRKTEDSSSCQHYENVKEYSKSLNMEYDDNPGWIPLAEVTNIVPQLDVELNENPEWSHPDALPKIVVVAEHISINENLSEDQYEEQLEEGIDSLGRDLQKSVDLETLSDYEDMASSFSSHHIAIKSNQQTFPFLSSTEIEVAQETVQKDDDKQEEDTTNPMRDTLQSKQASSDSSNTGLVKKRKPKVFQYCLIFITLAVATAALVLSTLIYVKFDHMNPSNSTYYPQ